MFAQFSASLQQISTSVSASVDFEVLSLFDEENESKLQYMTNAIIESRGTYMSLQNIQQNCNYFPKL